MVLAHKSHLELQCSRPHYVNIMRKGEGGLEQIRLYTQDIVE